MLNQRKTWTIEEDQLLSQLYEQQREKIQTQTLHWNFIAQKLNQLKNNSNRSGKQCRQRWFNQLNPQINKSNHWTQNEKTKLIELHNLYGNRWALISKSFPGRTDNSIKNFMNSTLRRTLRLINLFVSKNRKFKQFKYKNLKELKVDLVNKILFFSGPLNLEIDFEENFFLSTLSLNRQKTLTKVYQLSADIKSRLMYLHSQYGCEGVNLIPIIAQSSVCSFQQVIQSIHQLNAICKKRKQRRSTNSRAGLKKTYTKNRHEDLSCFNFHSVTSDKSVTFSNQQEQNQPTCSDLNPVNREDNSQHRKNKKTQSFESMDQKVELLSFIQVDVRLENQKILIMKKSDYQKIIRQSKNWELVKQKITSQKFIHNTNEITAIIKSGQTHEKDLQNLTKQIIPNQTHKTYKFNPECCQNSGVVIELSSEKNAKEFQSDNLPNKKYDSSDEWAEQEQDQFVFYDIVSGQNYLPLYPAWLNSHHQQISDLNQIKDNQNSQEEVI